MTVTSYERIPEIVAADHDSAIARRLEALWQTKPGIVGWFSMSITSGALGRPAP